jgi:hypothetical protein
MGVNCGVGGSLIKKQTILKKKDEIKLNIPSEYFLLKFNTLMNKRHKIGQTTPFMDFFF